MAKKKIHVGNLRAESGVAYDFTEISGNLVIPEGIEATFANLKTVGGDVTVYGSAKLDAPALKTVGGYVHVSGSAKLDAPALKTVGGYVHVSGSAKLDAPALKTVGGYVHVSGSANIPKDVKSNDPKAREAAQKALDSDLARDGLTLDDGILAHVVRRRGPVTVIRRIGKTTNEYVVTDGTHKAHGGTLAEARADLRVKQGARDTSAFKAWKLKTEVTKEDMIVAYRAITGACGAGVRAFLEGKSIPAKITVAKTIELTKGQYGSGEFQKFFGREASA